MWDGRARKECFNKTTDCKLVNTKKKQSDKSSPQSHPNQLKKANRKRDPMEKYLDELPN